MSYLQQNKRAKHTNLLVDKMHYPFSLPELPYKKNALQPYMSEQTLDFHHGKHHNTYVQALNKLLAEKPAMHKHTLEEIIVEASGDKTKAGIFNNAAQMWNHTFFWHSMAPKGGKKPHGKLFDKIEEDFGSYDQFVESFKAAGMAQFGSGWVWLVYNHTEKKLSILKTPNADTPITQQHACIINCDVWEHAYYLDYQNKRLEFISVFLESLVNWEFASENFENASQK